MSREVSSQIAVPPQRGQASQRAPQEAHKQSYQLDLMLGVLLTAVTGSVFVSTACPTVYWYDSAEMATAAATLGIPHPPGYPLYTIVAWIFTWLPVEPAYAVNLMSACFGALAVGTYYLLARTQPLGRLASAIGALTLGFSPLVWSNSTVAEVYMPGLVVLNGVLHLLLRGIREGRPQLSVAAAFIAGLGLGFHMSIAVCGLGLAWLAWLPTHRPASLASLSNAWDHSHRSTRLRRLLPLTGATLLGACIFLWLPIRSAMQPDFMYTTVDTPRDFYFLVTSKTYQSFFKDGIAAGAVASYLGDKLITNLTWPGIGLLLTGVVVTIQRTPKLAAVWALCAITNFAIFYNYGVHDLEVFFIPTFLMCVWAFSNGIDAAIHFLEEKTHRKAILRLSAGTILTLIPLTQLTRHFNEQDRAEDTSARLWGETFMDTLPPDALLISFDSRPEWHLASVARYFRFALGVRPDIEEWTRATPESVVEELRKGRPVYTYVGQGLPQQRFRLEQEGLLWRVLGIEMRGLRPPKS